MSECGTCGEPLGPDERFCGECGTPVAQRCHACGSPLAAGKKFCTACGAPATVPGEPPVAKPGPEIAVAGELRVVSVIFCDLVGFTSRSESLEPDVVRELLSGYFDQARAIIGRHGGMIEKFIGDAVMAVWGVPVALENDAERAVRASLELVDAVHAFGEANHLEGLAARVGVVTGQAAAMDSVEEGIVVGDRVNTAARIQALAEPGAVFVDSTTRAATASAIAYADAGEHAVKGKAEPVPVWRAERAIAGALGTNRGDGLEAELVGRDRELRLVKDLFHGSAERRGARLVSIVGPAGVGKSRLASEFENYVDGLALTVLWHRGKCLSYGEGVAYWALAQIVRQRFGIGEQDPEGVVRSQLRTGLDELIPRAEDRTFIEPRVAQLLGAADVDLARDDLFAGWRMLFERLAESDPVVMVIDDLQWADAGLLDFLDTILDWSSAHPIFLLTLARPELAERRPGWGQRRNGTSLGLEPLDSEAMLHLLDDLVDLPTDVGQTIVDQAEGIPLYAVEIVRSLVDRGLVEGDGDRPALVGSLGDLEVPATLTALLVARLDGLPPDERTLARDLAVLGTSFPRAAIEAVAEPTGAQLDDLLASLVRREVLTVIADPLSPERGQLQFAQSLMRTVIYDNLTRRERKHRHIAVADHLEVAFPDRGAEVAEVIAEHLHQALDADPHADDAEELQTRATEAYQRAGDRAAALGAHAGAAVAYQRALSLVADPAIHAELLFRGGSAATMAGWTDDGIELLDRATLELRALGRESEALESVTRAARALAASGQPDAATALMEAEARALLPDATDRGTTGMLVFYAHNRVLAGRVDDTTRDLLDRATSLAEGLGDRRLLADVLSASGLRHNQLGNWVMARTLGAASVELAREVNDLEGLYRALTNYGQMLAGNDEPAEVVLEEALVAGQRLGNPVVVAIGVCNVTREHLRRGRWDELVKEVGRYVDGVTTRTGAADSEPILHLALVAAGRGDRTEVARLRPQADECVTDDPQDQAAFRTYELLLDRVGGQTGPDFVADVERHLDDVVASYGWRSDNPPFLWPAGVDAALEDGDLPAVERLLARLDALGPGHRRPFLSAEALRARALLAVARGDEAVDPEALLRAAIAQLGQLGMRVPEARTRLDLRDWLRTQGRDADGELVAASCGDVAHALGAVALLDRL